MKKLSFLFFCILIFVLCSCKNTDKFIPITKNLSFTAESVFGATEYSINTICDNNGNLTFCVKKPENIKDLKLIFSNKNVKVCFYELEKEIPLVNLEENSLFKIIYCAFSNTENIEYHNGEYRSIFTVNEEEYEIIFSEFGIPLEIKSENCKITFKGTSILN